MSDTAADNPGRGKNGQYLRTLEGATKDAVAAGLRASGTSYKVIAAKLGYANESGAHKAVQRALASVPVEDVTELRALEAARLDALTEKVWGVLNTKYPHEVAGRMIVDQNDKPVGDPAVILAAVDRLARISDQRARLLGLNAPAPRAPAEPKPSGLELTAQQVAVLQRLLAALPIEAADTLPLALTMGDEQPQEAP